MRLFARALLATGVLAVAVGVAGCGSNGSLLTQGAATQLSSDLNQASSALNQYNCPAAESALTNFANDVSELQGVNTTLVSMLSQGASTITALARTRCPTVRPTTSTRTTRTTDTTTTDSSTNTTTTGSTTATDTTPVTTTTDTSTSGGQPFGTVTTTPGDTVTTASTPTAPVTVPDTGGAGLGSTGASGNTGAGAAGGGSGQ